MVSQALSHGAPARIPMRTIRSLARQIAQRYHPEQIILFGSYAYGKSSPFSDVDLLVVMETPRGEMEARTKDEKTSTRRLFYFPQSCHPIHSIIPPLAK